LSSFFDGGRVLDDDIDWLIARPWAEEYGEIELGDDAIEPDGISWELNKDALQAFLADGIFAPSVDLQESEFEVGLLENDVLPELIGLLFEQLRRDVAANYY